MLFIEKEELKNALKHSKTLLEFGKRMKTLQGNFKKIVAKSTGIVKKEFKKLESNANAFSLFFLDRASLQYTKDLLVKNLLNNVKKLETLQLAQKCEESQKTPFIIESLKIEIPKK